MLTTADLIRYYEATGQRVTRTANAYWYSPSPMAWSIFPYRVYPPVDAADFSQLWREHRGAVIARVVRQSEVRSSSTRAIYVCAADHFGIEALSANTRSKIRRGLRSNVVRRVPISVLATQGAPLYASTLSRQGLRVPPGWRGQWERICRGASNGGFEGWGAFHDGSLTAMLLGFHFDGRYHLSMINSGADALKTYPNNALIFAVTSAVLAEAAVVDVSYGLESVQLGLDGLDSFKVSMGFARVPLVEIVLLRPGLRPLRRPANVLANVLARRFPDRGSFRKAAGLLAAAGPEAACHLDY